MATSNSNRMVITCSCGRKLVVEQSIFMEGVDSADETDQKDLLTISDTKLENKEKRKTSDPAHFTYTSKGKSLKGTRIPELLIDSGPITLFSTVGHWSWKCEEWKTKDAIDIAWNKMIRGDGGRIESAPVLLPSEYGELCIQFVLQNNKIQNELVGTFWCFSDFSHNKTKEGVFPINLAFILCISHEDEVIEIKCVCEREKLQSISSFKLICLDAEWDAEQFPMIDIYLL